MGRQPCYSVARREALHTTIQGRRENYWLLDIDKHWSRLEGALLAMTDKMEKGASLPSAIVCLVSDAASASLSRGEDDQDLMESHQNSGDRAQSYMRAHRDYDRLCEKMHAEKAIRSDEEEADELVERLEPSGRSQQSNPATHSPYDKLLRTPVPSYHPPNLCSPTRNAHRSWDFMLSARDKPDSNSSQYESTREKEVPSPDVKAPTPVAAGSSAHDESHTKNEEAAKPAKPDLKSTRRSTATRNPKKGPR